VKIRIWSQGCWMLGVIFCLLGSLDAAAAGVEHDAAQKTWTLTSGAEMYRLVERNGIVSVDYFGPRTESPNGGTQVPIGRELMGEAEGESLSASAMRLVDAQSNSPTPGVQVLELTLRHKRLALDIVAKYTAWAETGVFTREIMIKNTGRLRSM
jgi:hypothetical protein